MGGAEGPAALLFHDAVELQRLGELAELPIAGREVVPPVQEPCLVAGRLSHARAEVLLECECVAVSTEDPIQPAPADRDVDGQFVIRAEVRIVPDLLPQQVGGDGRLVIAAHFGQSFHQSSACLVGLLDRCAGPAPDGQDLLGQIHRFVRIAGACEVPDLVEHRRPSGMLGTVDQPADTHVAP